MADIEFPISYNCIVNLNIDPETSFIVNKEFYTFSKLLNTCWGQKIFVTKNGTIKPCLHSNILLGDINDIEKKEFKENLLTYWKITKENIETCKVCEFRRICLDCRVVNSKNNIKDILKKPVNCNYDPYKGLWIEI